MRNQVRCHGRKTVTGRARVPLGLPFQRRQQRVSQVYPGALVGGDNGVAFGSDGGHVQNAGIIDDSHPAPTEVLLVVGHPLLERLTLRRHAL